MKAYMVMYKDNDWCDFVHAENVRQARNLFWREWSWLGEFLDRRALRAPTLDDIPLTGANIVNAGYDESWIDQDSQCRCQICIRQEQTTGGKT